MLDWTIIGPVALALIALGGTVANTIAQRRTARDAHEVSKAAGIITGYDSLCRRLEAEISVKTAEIADLRVRLVAIEQREREWAVEREALRGRIAKLEDERNQLRDELEELRARYCERG